MMSCPGRYILDERFNAPTPLERHTYSDMFYFAPLRKDAEEPDEPRKFMYEILFFVFLFDLSRLLCLYSYHAPRPSETRTRIP